MGTMWMSPLVSHKSFSSTFCRFFSVEISPNLMGTSGLEPPTSRLSGVRSNHLSYAPILNLPSGKFKTGEFDFKVNDLDLLRKPSNVTGFADLFFNSSLPFMQLLLV